MYFTSALKSNYVHSKDGKDCIHMNTKALNSHLESLWQLGGNTLQINGKVLQPVKTNMS